MKTIISGSRSATKEQVYLAMELCPKTSQITEGVCGMATGADLHGKQWCDERSIPVKPFEAAWDEISRPGSVIRRRSNGALYNAAAGPIRNSAMVEYAGKQGMLIATWNGMSKGTMDVIGQAAKQGMYIFVLLTSTSKAAERWLTQIGVSYRIRSK